MDPRDIMVNLVTNNAEMADAWRVAFRGLDGIRIFEGDFAEFMRRHPEIDGVVAPANSYGLMDGGFDRAIAEWFGPALPKAVRAYIMGHFCGEQPIATSFAIDVPGCGGMKLIHTPTMRIPNRILDPMVVYQCMRTSMIVAADAGCTNIVVPAFGGTTGFLPFMKIAQLMAEGYMQVCNPPSEITWKYADSRDLESRYQ